MLIKFISCIMRNYLKYSGESHSIHRFTTIWGSTYCMLFVFAHDSTTLLVLGLMGEVSRSHSDTPHSFDVHRSVHRNYIPKVKPTRCKSSQIYLFLRDALHVSGGTSAHHQEH